MDFIPGKDLRTLMTEAPAGYFFARARCAELG
jgi:hypothetical protein